MRSAVLIIPAAHLPAINALGQARDWGPDNYTVPLGPDAETAATHYGARVDVTDTFLAELAGAAQGNLPAADWEALGTTAQAVGAAVAALITSFDPAPDSEEGAQYPTPRAHFQAVLEANNLVRV